LLQVEHLHRLGNCRGRLVASRLGLQFIPDESPSKDAFSFSSSEYLSSLADNTLTIKSNTKTYRFRAVAVPGRPDSAALLPGFAASLERLR